MQTYSQESVAAAAECTQRQLASWTSELGKHGPTISNGQIPQNQAVAIGAALKFTQAGIGKARVQAIFRELLRSSPEGDDWLVVDRRKRSLPISVEKAPFSAEIQSSRSRPPVVFDPLSFVERLDAN